MVRCRLGPLLLYGGHMRFRPNTLGASLSQYQGSIDFEFMVCCTRYIKRSCCSLTNGARRDWEDSHRSVEWHWGPKGYISGLCCQSSSSILIVYSRRAKVDQKGNHLSIPILIDFEWYELKRNTRCLFHLVRQGLYLKPDIRTGDRPIKFEPLLYWKTINGIFVRMDVPCGACKRSTPPNPLLPARRKQKYDKIGDSTHSEALKE